MMERTRDDVLDDLRTIMNSQSGANFLCDILDECHIGNHLYCHEGYVALYNFGRTLIDAMYEADSAAAKRVVLMVHEPKLNTMEEEE